MAKKKRKSKVKRRKRVRAKTSRSLNLKAILKAAAVVCVFVALVAGFVLLGRYGKKAAGVSEKTAMLVLLDSPSWLNEDLKEKIYTAARADGEDLKLDEDAAKSVQENIQNMVSWVESVRVRATDESLLVAAKWRKPVAMVKLGRQKFYVDRDMVVMDYVPVAGLSIVRVKGLSVTLEPPGLGRIWRLDDLRAAMVLLEKFSQMDESIAPNKPLLSEIASIDMTNFDGRIRRTKPHIVLYTKDDTKIIWGSEFGTWQHHLEAPDEEKLVNLYAYYKENGTLLGDAKYINLRYSRDSVSRPIDKY